MWKYSLATVSLLSIFSSTAQAITTVPTENLLVSSNNTIYEFSQSGTLLQSFATQYPGGYPSTERARDIAIDAQGTIHVYNGTSNPYMSSYNSYIDSWTHVTHPGFSTINNGTYGGIDVYESTVFATDMNTFNGEAQGIVAFSDLGVTRFAENIAPIDLTVGLDGLLYALSPGGSPSGTMLSVYNPDNYSLVNEIDLHSIFGHTAHRAIAVDQNGDLFIADLDGEIHHVNNSGVLLDTVSANCYGLGFESACSFFDIDISYTGDVALGSRFGEVILTDSQFSSFSSIDLGNHAGTFVEFAPVPIPAAVWLFGSGMIALFGLARRKRS